MLFAFEHCKRTLSLCCNDLAVWCLRPTQHLQVPTDTGVHLQTWWVPLSSWVRAQGTCCRDCRWSPSPPSHPVDRGSQSTSTTGQHCTLNVHRLRNNISYKLIDNRTTFTLVVSWLSKNTEWAQPQKTTTIHHTDFMPTSSFKSVLITKCQDSKDLIVHLKHHIKNGHCLSVIQ